MTGLKIYRLATILVQMKEQLKLEKILGPEKKRKRLLLEKAVPEGEHHLLFQLLRRKEFLFLLKVPGREDLPDL
jgi:hypothetical protein